MAPPCDVMRLAMFRPNRAPRHCTGGIHRSQRPTLRLVGQPHGSPKIYNHPIAVEHHRNDGRHTRHPPIRLDRQLGCTANINMRLLVHTVHQGFEIDYDGHLEPIVRLINGALPRTAARNEVRQGQSSEVILLVVASRAIVGHRCMKHGLDQVLKTALQPDARIWVELAAQTPHAAFWVDPPPHTDVAPLLHQAVFA